MTDIKGQDPITRPTKPGESKPAKRNLGRAAVWAMIGLGLGALIYFIFMFVVAGSRA